VHWSTVRDVLDPVYTGRAMAGLIAAVREGDVRPGERTVLLRTGGLPGLRQAEKAGRRDKKQGAKFGHIYRAPCD
jgi:hypothetical protein